MFFKDSQLWYKQGKLYQLASQLVLNKTYVYPENQNVQITFTKLPENPGTLKIEEVALNDQQINQLGALSENAYDISSDMADGSFEYELKLPRPEESGDKDKIAYAESLDQLDQAEEINPELRQDEQLVARGLDHFTIFVVVSPLPGGTNNGDACTVASIDGTCYDTLQAAIDNAIASDTIEVAGDLSLTHQVDVNKSVSINGNGHTIQAAFAKTGNDNNAALGIFADNVTLANLTLDGFLGTKLHGVNAYVSQNILLDGVSLLNFPYAGMIVNGSTVTVNNISTSGNGWGGINIDQGGGVTSAAQLTVNGYSSHSDSTHI